ncbi:MAG: tRNA preQ1(34) S-adenosylmethionine ribosyltransferase-isomerase QueA [SAR202 cluster bacterium]|nr:tRNA preQ1(34) S-adenosylmethionine ribosyltransferase-isomerase QueA [SAR202 cluster bacterium]
MKITDFDYHLPEELIAQTPIEPRDHSRLMVVSRADGAIAHRRFFDLPEYLRPGDLLVFNDSRVFPARMYGKRTDTGTPIELLLLRRIMEGVWQSLVKPGRKMRSGDRFELTGNGRTVPGQVLTVNDDGSRVIRLGDESAIDALGIIPLPPYIHAPLQDFERYQTVYSRARGSVAAPTAGLHFTPALLERIRAMGAETAFVTLHVGWDTFRPIQVEDTDDHKMHSEYYEITPEAAEAIKRAKREGRRVVTVGTTAVRLLEYAAGVHAATGREGIVSGGSGWANIFIAPGYKFLVPDALITNFHLPKSTLLMLVSAFASRDTILQAYAVAISERYRFYSFGDAMVIL